jgi:hypothetical protein
MKRLKHILIASVVFLGGCAGNTTYYQSPVTNVAKTATTGKIRILTPWEKNRMSIQCAAIETDSAGYKLQSIVFYQDSISRSSVIYAAPNKDYPVAILPLRDDAGNLLTVWDDSREYKIRMYGMVDGKITLLFEDESRTFPELIFEKKEMENMSILITNTGLVKNKKTKSKDELPVTAALYRWKDGEYTKSSVPWAKRFSSGK